MKTIFKCILAILTVSFTTVACNDMNSIIQDDLDRGEAIYPGKVFYIEGVAGIGNAKLYWATGPDSRITKTVITWGNDGYTEKAITSVMTIDSIAGSVTKIDSIQITGLEEGLYTFSAYTIDKDENKSIAVSSPPINVYGNSHVKALSTWGIEKTEMLVGGDLRITWREAPTGILYTLVTYFDHRENENGVPTTVDTVVRRWSGGEEMVITTTLPGLKRLKPFTVRSVYQVGLDTASVTANYYPAVVEKTILEANGLTELTAEAAARITKLTFPFGTENSWTLQDLYYFPNLEELEFTAPSELPTLTYERNGVSSTVGGGTWPYYVSGYMSDNNRNIIKNLLASGQFNKIKYTRNSYPRFDDDLVQSIGRGEVEVEWVPAEPLPNDFMVTPNLLVDYRVEDNARGATVDHQEDGSNVPDEIAEKFDGELRNVYKVRVTASNSSIAFSLPEGVQFVFEPHGVLNFDAYLEATDTAYTWMKPAGTSKYESWNRIMCRRKSRLDNFPNTSPYGSNSNGAGPTWNVNTELGTWKNLSWALQTVPQEHIRVIEMQMGNGGAWGLPSGQTLTYYIANLRWTHK